MTGKAKPKKHTAKEIAANAVTDQCIADMEKGGGHQKEGGKRKKRKMAHPEEGEKSESFLPEKLSIDERFMEMDERFNKLESSHNQVLKEMTTLKVDNNQVLKEMTTLKVDNNQVLKDMTTLKVDNNQVLKEMTTLKVDNNQVLQGMATLKADYAKRLGLEYASELSEHLCKIYKLGFLVPSTFTPTKWTKLLSVDIYQEDFKLFAIHSTSYSTAEFFVKEMQFISTMRIGEVHVEHIEDLLQLIHTFSEDGFLQILEEKMPRVALFLQERLLIVRVFIAKARLLRLALYVTLHARRSLDLGARKWETIGKRETIGKWETKAKKWLETVATLTNTKQKDISKIVDDMEGKAMYYGPKVMLVGVKQTPCPSSTDIRRLFDWCNVHNMFDRNLKAELLFAWQLLKRFESLESILSS